MKIKLGFVTNSSSSSFVVMGAYVEKAVIPIEFLKDLGEEDLFDLYDQLCRGSELDYSFGPEMGYGEESAMVGLPYTKMRDDETLKQFKERAQLLILEKFGVATTVGHIQECWMDN